jgi:hypothetical protein
VDKAKIPVGQALERGRRAVGRGSGMADVVPDEQGLSGHEAETVEIQKGWADDRREPGRMRQMDAAESERGRCICPGDSTR